MSVTDPSADVAQPDTESQGDQGQSQAGDSPYSEYLQRVPEEVRGDVEPIFKEWDANVTRRFQEASEYRKGWEPYEQAGVQQYAPEQVQWGLQFLQALENPQAIQQWYEQYAQEHGLQAQQAQEEFDGGFQGYDPSQEQLDQLLEQRLGPLAQQLEEYGQRWQQLEEGAQNAQIEGQLTEAVQELKAKEAANLPAELDFDDMIERFAQPYAQPGADPKEVIARGWADFQQYMHAIERGVLQSKVNAPNPAEGGGVPDVNPPQYKSIMDPGVQNEAQEFLRNSNRARQ